MIRGRVSRIETLGLADGPGVRTVVFLHGCPLRCVFCHNPEMWSGGDYTEYTPRALLDILLKYSKYYGADGGVTFSGGEPLMQSEFLLESLKLCKQHGIHTCLDTAGGATIASTELLDYVDIVILDIKAVTREDYMRITGKSILNFHTFLLQCHSAHKALWLRQVIVPGINDDPTYIAALAEYIHTLHDVQRVELLPYHTMAKDKYTSLGLVYPLSDTPAMAAHTCAHLQGILNELLNVS